MEGADALLPHVQAAWSRASCRSMPVVFYDRKSIRDRRFPAYFRTMGSVVPPASRYRVWSLIRQGLASTEQNAATPSASLRRAACSWWPATHIRFLQKASEHARRPLPSAAHRPTTRSGPVPPPAATRMSRSCRHHDAYDQGRFQHNGERLSDAVMGDAVFRPARPDRRRSALQIGLI